MKKLIIDNTAKTPFISFEPDSGVFEISGVSVPENAIEFYTQVVDWLKEYGKNPHSKTVISFKLSYLNTSSLQFLYDVLKELDKILEPPLVVVNWYYLAGDTDMLETGEDFKGTTRVQFNLIEV